MRTAKVAPSAGMSGAQIDVTWSYSATGTIARMAMRLIAATASANASQPATRTPAGSDASQVIAGLYAAGQPAALTSGGRVTSTHATATTTTPSAMPPNDATAS